MNIQFTYLNATTERQPRGAKRKLKRTEPNPNKTCVHTERFWGTVEIRKFQWGDKMWGVSKLVTASSIVTPLFKAGNLLY